MQRDILLVNEMIDAAEQAQLLTNDVSIDELAANRQRHDALLWNFTVIGEAANQISEEARKRFPRIPWEKPIQLRNRIVHGYWSVDVEILHTTARRQLPELISDLRKVANILSDKL